ncbi:MAG: sigma-54-dependent transcriptional regulator [Acidobacteriota bacterium]
MTEGEGDLGRILIVEDDAFLLEQLTWALKGRFAVSSARDATEGRARLDAGADVYLFDLRLPPSRTVEEGFGLLREARRRDPDATVVVMSGESDRREALRAIELGAFDFFRKPVDAAELQVILGRALERRRLLAENRALRLQAGTPGPFDRLVGQSAPMRRLFEDIRRVAPSDATVLIVGESGTGKELVAHAIHEGSPRANRPFVAVNAAALPESLAESELFGHEKGAFTGAVSSRPGRFELASGGTLFLDEIGTLSLALQAKLLRAIESREIERVGGRRAIAIDLRLISATNEDLEARAAQGSFREDLLYRINTIPLRIPPLRERLEDLAPLCDHFLAKFADRHGRPGRRLSAGVLDRFREHAWRGNVRELEHVIEMLVLFSDREEIGEEDLPRALRGRATGAVGPQAGVSFEKAVEDFERRLLTDAIGQAGGVKAEAARRLGLDPNQIKYLCRKYGI